MEAEEKVDVESEVGLVGRASHEGGSTYNFEFRKSMNVIKAKTSLLYKKGSEGQNMRTVTRIVVKDSCHWLVQQSLAGPAVPWLVQQSLAGPAVP